MRFGLKAAIPQRTKQGVVVSHTYSDLVRLNWGDMLKDVQDFNPTISLDWQGQPEFTSISGGLLFARFHKDGHLTFGTDPKLMARDGSKEDVAGWVLRPRLAPLDCKIGTTTLDAGNFDSKWKPLQGTFETTSPNTNPAATRITNVGTDVTARAQTIGTIAARRGLQWDIHCVGILDATGPAPRLRCVMQQKKYSLLLPHGAKPAVQIQDGLGGWSTIRALKDLPNVELSRGDYKIEMFILNDRLVVGVNGHYFHIQEMQKPVAPKAQPKPKACDIPEGPVQFNAHNCRVTMGLSLLKWADPADVAYSGAFAVQVKKKTFLTTGTQLIPHATGSTPGGTTLAAAATVTEGTTGSIIDYTVTLTASPAGIETPLVTKCLIYKAPVWSNPVAAAIEARAALVGTWDITHAMPPIMSDGEATFSFDRKMLSSKVASNWQDYISEDNPCEVLARWQQKDDVTGAVTYDPPSGYYRLFKGYVAYIQKQTDGYNTNTMLVKMRGPMLRLQGNNARIDYRYPPLDWVFLDAAASASTPVTGQSLPSLSSLTIYGADCIQEMVRIALGDDEANVMNGNGNARRFLPSDHPALLSTDTDAGGLLALYDALKQPVTQNGWYFPPPFGDDVESWMKKIGSEIDRCVSFYGWPDGAFVTDWPVLCYGRIPEFLKKLHPTRSTFIRIPDSNYLAGDVNKLLQMASTETRPERNINRVLTLGDTPTGGLEAVLPSLRMGEARLPPSDPRSPENSWEKTHIIRNSIYQFPGAAEAVAMKIIADITGLLMQFPVFQFRGFPVQWGSICQLVANGSGSDATLGLTGLPFRVEQVKHTGSAGQISDWKTSVNIRPLSTSELDNIPVL